MKIYTLGLDCDVNYNYHVIGVFSTYKGVVDFLLGLKCQAFLDNEPKKVITNTKDLYQKSLRYEIFWRDSEGKLGGHIKNCKNGTLPWYFDKTVKEKIALAIREISLNKIEIGYDGD